MWDVYVDVCVCVSTWCVGIQKVLTSFRVQGKGDQMEEITFSETGFATSLSTLLTY